MSLVWCFNSKGCGWYLVKDWLDDKKVKYKHGPFDTVDEAIELANKKKINIIKEEARSI